MNQLFRAIKALLTFKTMLWAIYLALLGVLLPHTAWAFANHEAGDDVPMIAWAGAFAFEAMIAVLTHMLAKHLERTRKRRNVSRWQRLSERCLNAYAVGLLMAVIVSTLANLAHAVQFGTPIRIFTEWGVPPGVYAVAFGAILPVASLVFARVLSNEAEAEQEEDTALKEANAIIRDLRRALREAEQRAAQAEQRYDTLGDVVVKLFGDNKRERILVAREQWPQLPVRSVAVVCDVSAAYASEVLSNQ